MTTIATMTEPVPSLRISTAQSSGTDKAYHQALDALVNAPLKTDLQDPTSREPTDTLKHQPKDISSAMILANRACPACHHAPFLRVDHLKHHILGHLGAKPYVCVECQRTYRQLYSLRRHQRTSGHVGQSKQHVDIQPLFDRLPETSGTTLEADIAHSESAKNVLTASDSPSLHVPADLTSPMLPSSLQSQYYPIQPTPYMSAMTSASPTTTASCSTSLLQQAVVSLSSLGHLSYFSQQQRQQTMAQMALLQHLQLRQMLAATAMVQPMPWSQMNPFSQMAMASAPHAQPTEVLRQASTTTCASQEGQPQSHSSSPGEQPSRGPTLLPGQPPAKRAK
eukprot:m.45610 g.45610  ORF g.45610 m.45610 type:complete len:337 (+) comp13096_c0_seq1:281-1291(+)